jgi:hypothetical protein
MVDNYLEREETKTMETERTCPSYYFMFLSVFSIKYVCPFYIYCRTLNNAQFKMIYEVHLVF